MVGKITQPLDTFSMPVQLRIDTEGNPELKTVDVTGTESTFTVETFGRPKPGGIKIDPNNVVLKGNTSLRARAAIARGEELAETGRYYDAIQQYQKALNIQPGRPLANFRMGEAFFYQKNYQAAANAFRESLQAVPEPSEKWTEVWGHLYLGMIFDLLGQRERAVNEYSKAKQTNDNTGSARNRRSLFEKTVQRRAAPRLHRLRNRLAKPHRRRPPQMMDVRTSRSLSPDRRSRPYFDFDFVFKRYALQRQPGKLQDVPNSGFAYMRE